MDNLTASEQEPFAAIPKGLSTEQAAQAFAALGSEQRLLVLRALVRAGPEGLSMGMLAQRCDMGASTLTHHIRFLSQAGLIAQTREGRSIICAAVAFNEVTALSQYLLEECCADTQKGCSHGN